MTAGAPDLSEVRTADGVMRTYSTGLTADVESTATSSSAGAIIDGVRIIAFCLQGGLLDN